MDQVKGVMPGRTAHSWLIVQNSESPEEYRLVLLAWYVKFCE